MARKPNHEKNNLDVQVAQDSRDESSMLQQMAMEGRLGEHALQEDVIRSLLQWPGLLEQTRVNLTKTSDWMIAHPDKTLTPAIWAWVRRIDTARKIAMGREKEGRDLAPYDPSKTRKRRPRNRLMKTPRLEWMDNPALLPKRPPGAV